MRRQVRAIAIEAVVVAAFACGVAFAANALSPRGLQLGRDYFPRGKNLAGVVASPGRATVASDAATPTDGATAAVVRRLEQAGLQVATSREVAEWFRDPQYEQGLIVFVDARDDAHYRAGHIPGAWQFDHYRPEAHLPVVLPVCLAALKIVVYCRGGDCEDSEFAAAMLRDAGVPSENLYVYPGGMVDWTARQLPIETGRRGGEPGRSQP